MLANVWPGDPILLNTLQEENIESSSTEHLGLFPKDL